MIGYSAAQLMVAKANRLYDRMLADGDWNQLTAARKRCLSQKCSDLSDLCLCILAECRNPSPIQDIPDYRHLIALANEGVEVDSKQFLIAVYQKIIKNPLMLAGSATTGNLLYN